MRLAIFVVALTLAACDGKESTGTPTSPGRGNLTNITVGPGETITKIQPALDSASPNATIIVLPGTYAERLVIRKPVKVRGQRATLDGLAGGLDGRYVGIEVDANDVEITGFIIQNYERGIVVEATGTRDLREHFVLRGNEIRNNTSKDPPPISAGVTKSDGVVLNTVQNSEIADNFFHDNGSIGLWLSRGSSGNRVYGNRFVNNGTQQGLQGSGSSGAAIFTSGLNNTRNQIFDNDVSGSYWGIAIGGQPDSNNEVRNNRVHDNFRAGIMVGGQHNLIEGNVATNNGLANLFPSCRLDFMNGHLENTWRNNTGTFGPGYPQPPLPPPVACGDN
jgi:parallel beta-helix repeat protein